MLTREQFLPFLRDEVMYFLTKKLLGDRANRVQHTLLNMIKRQVFNFH